MSTTPSDHVHASAPPVPLGVARRTHPLTVGLELAGLVATIAMEAFSTLFPGMELAVQQWAVAVVFLGPRVLGWWFRTYTVTERHLAMDEGILQRRHRVVPYSRIQQVDIHQRFLPQLLGLAKLRIETAGEGGADAVSLHLLTKPEAEALRHWVLDRRLVHGERPAAGAPHPVDAEPPKPPRLLLQISPAQLLLAAVTRTSGLMVAGWGLVVAGWVGAWALSRDQGIGEGAGVLAGTVGLVLVALGGAIVIARVLNDWNWTLSERGDDLHVQAGLLQVRQQTLPRRRIQQVAMVDNPLRRMLGLAGVVMHTAVTATSTDGLSTTVEVPVVARDQLDAFLARLMGPAWVPPPLTRRPPVAARRAVVRRVVLLIVAFAGPGLVWPGPLLVLAPLALLGLPWGLTAHRRAGWAVTTDLVVLAAGVVHHRMDLLPRSRIQSTRTRSSPFQRRVDLATLEVDVAGTTWRGPLSRSPGLYDMDASTADYLRPTLPTR